MSREFDLDEELLLETITGAQRWRTYIIGRKAGNYIILDPAVDDPMTRQLQIGDVVWVYCSEIPVCRFQTRIRHIVTDPPLIVLDYPLPRDIEGIEHRRDERKKVFIHADCFLDKDHKERFPGKGYVLNISESGCLLLIDLTEFLHRDVFFSLPIPWTGETIQGRARVVRCDITDKGVRSALKFIDLDPASRETLDGFISSLEPAELFARIIKTKVDETGAP